MGGRRFVLNCRESGPEAAAPDLGMLASCWRIIESLKGVVGREIISLGRDDHDYE